MKELMDSGFLILQIIIFIIINIYFKNLKTIPRNNHAAPLNKPGLIPLVAGVRGYC